MRRDTDCCSRVGSVVSTFPRAAAGAAPAALFRASAREAGAASPSTAITAPTATESPSLASSFSTTPSTSAS